MPLGTLYGIGLGPGTIDYVTLRAAEVIRKVDIIFTVCGPRSKSSVSQNIVEQLGAINGEIYPLLFSMSVEKEFRQKTIEENAEIIREHLQRGLSCAFTTIGDPFTYSTFSYILQDIQKSLPELEVEVVPGVTSFASLASRSQLPLVEDTEKLQIVPGFDERELDDIEFPSGTTTVLMKFYKNREKLIERLVAEGRHQILYGSKIGMAEEFITSDVSLLKDLPREYLSLMVVKSS